jgi:hypothetical protein
LPLWRGHVDAVDLEREERMAKLGVCPKVDCGADIMIPRRVGAQIQCDECDTVWVVEDLDPLELVSVDEDEDDWGEDDILDDDLDDLDEPLETARGGGSTGVATKSRSRPAAQMQWECSECGMMAEGMRPPRQCPGCGASGDHFNLIASEDASAEFEDEAEPEDDEL